MPGKSFSAAARVGVDVARGLGDQARVLRHLFEVAAAHVKEGAISDDSDVELGLFGLHVDQRVKRGLRNLALSFCGS